MGRSAASKEVGQPSILKCVSQVWRYVRHHRVPKQRATELSFLAGLEDNRDHDYKKDDDKQAAQGGAVRMVVIKIMKHRMGGVSCIVLRNKSFGKPER